VKRSILAALVLAGCSTTHGVRPLGKGTWTAEGSLGGPITEVYGLPLPLPISTLGAGYGVTSTTDVHGAWHPSALAIFGLGAGELGASQQLLPPKGPRPRVMADLTLTVAGGDTAPGGPEGGVRAFMTPSATAGWDWGRNRRSTVFTGLGGFIEPAGARKGFGYWTAGNRWGLGARTHLDTELKWLAPYASSEAIVPEYASPGFQGAVAFQFGLGTTFGGAR
jgi:hypothetical protein